MAQKPKKVVGAKKNPLMKMRGQILIDTSKHGKNDIYLSLFQKMAEISKNLWP